MTEYKYLIILGIIVVILFVALIILINKVRNLQNKITDGKKTIIHEQTGAQTKEAVRKEQHKEQLIPEPERDIIHEINLTEGISDMNESMKRFAKKYHLDSTTLASMDGFSIASSHPDSEQEAANLTARYQVNGITEIGDTHIIPLEYKAEKILILFRTVREIPKEQAEMMMRDARIILSHWL